MEDSIDRLKGVAKSNLLKFSQCGITTVGQLNGLSNSNMEALCADGSISMSLKSLKNDTQ